eukprot:6554072-Pyramimonas_sp.AAC.1
MDACCGSCRTRRAWRTRRDKRRRGSPYCSRWGTWSRAYGSGPWGFSSKMAAGRDPKPAVCFT